ncbi:MAG TPA: LPS export ABC transporter periplasmic protein LptC [Gammaproteobacteria bacterium]|nr:LPS export ABC transporter periplasmic protein LptC [Gammaproteobacteria bacterium]
MWRDLARRHGVQLALLVAVLLTGWWLYDLDREAMRAKALKTHEPDYFMENFVRTQLDTAGQKKHRLQAKMMLHYPDDGSTELVQPLLEVYNADGPPWHVKSERGWISAKHDLVLLRGEVQIWRETAGGARDFEVLTRDVRVLPDDRYAETAQPAIIRSPSAEYHAVGMRAWLDENRLELLKQVRGHHEVHANAS